MIVFFYGADLGRLVENLPFSVYDDHGLPLQSHYDPIVIDRDTGFRVGRFEYETQRAARLFFPDQFPRPGFGYIAPLPSARELPRLVTDAVLRRDNGGEGCKPFRLCLLVGKFIVTRRLQQTGTSLYESRLLELPTGQPVGDFLLDYPGDAPDGLPPHRLGEKSPARQGWEMAQRIFPAIRDIANQHGVKFGTLFVPSTILVDYDPRDKQDYPLNRQFVREEMERAVQLQKPDRIFGGWMKSAQIPYLDPATRMRADREASGKKFYFPFDQHWNVSGHDSLGRHFAEWIESQVWF